MNNLIKIIFSVSLFTVLTWTVAYCAVVTFTKEYTYQASEFDSKASSRILSMEQIKKLLLEELGTYLISETEVKNYQMTKDQITVLTGGIVRTEIVDEKWDGKTYYLKAKLTTDPQEVAQQVEKLAQDKKIIKEFEATKKRADDLENEVIRLRQELTVKADGGKIKEYNDTINKLSATEWMQKGSALLGYGDKRGKKHDNNIEALKAFDKALELNPENPSLYFLRANILYIYEDSKDYAIILADLDKGMALDPAENYHNMKAKIYRDMGDWRKVVQELEKAITLQPRDAINSNEVYYDKPASNKNWSKENFDTIIAKFPKDYRAYILRGYFYGRYKAQPTNPKYYDLAIGDYKKAIGLNSKVPLTYYLLGMTYADKALLSSLSHDEFAENDHMAIVNLSKAIKLNPSYLVAYRQRAIIYYDLKEFKKAIGDYGKILEIDPGSEGIYYDRGRAYLELRQFEEAAGSFTNALNANKYDFVSPRLIFQGRAIAYFETGKYDKALVDYTKAIELREKLIKDAKMEDYFRSNDDDTSELYEARGKVYFQLGILNSAAAYAKDDKYSQKDSPEYLNAISDFTQAIKLYSQSSAYEDRSDAYAAIRDYQHALQDIDKSLQWYQEYKYNPGNIYFKRATIYSDLGNLKQAVNDFSLSIECSKQPGWVQSSGLYYVYYLRANAHMSLDENNAAIQDFTEAINRLPKYKAAYIDRGVAYSNLGNYKAALSDFDNAITLAPDEAIAYYNRGSVHIDLHDQKRGIEDYKIAARLGYKMAQDKLKALAIEW